MSEGKLNNTYILALTSVIFVSLMFNLFIRNEIDFGYLVLDINDMANLILQERKQVIEYILLKRLKQLILWVILIKAFGSEKIFYGLIVIFGGILGLLISAQVYYLGVLGLVILLLYIFPHYVIYFGGIYYGYKLRLFDVGTSDNMKKLLTTCLIFVFGVILECSFMTIFLKNFYQYMVS